MGEGRDRGQAHSQGRRLREHQRAVRAAGRAGASRPRRPDARRRQESDSSRRVERAREGMRAGRGRCLHRRRSHVRLHPRQGAAVPNARRCESGSAAGGARGVDHGVGQQPRDRRDGIRRQRHADRLQDRRAQPAAGVVLRVGGLRLLGVSPSRRLVECVDRRDRPLAVSRSVASDHSDARSGRIHAHRSRSRAAGAAQRRAGAIAQGRRRRPHLWSGVHRSRRGALRT